MRLKAGPRRLSAGGVPSENPRDTIHQCARWIAAFIAVGSACLALSTHVSAATPPRVDDVSPRGLQIGGVTRMTVRGERLSTSLRVFVPGMDAVRTEWIKGDAGAAELHVAIPADASPGIYPLRVIHEDGVSNALAVGIDALPQLDMRDTVVSLPVALHGSLKGADKQAVQFPGRAGQPLVIDVEGKRLGSALRPVLRLFGPDDRQLIIARPTSRLGGDARLALTLPTDGIYRVELQDLLYRGPEPGWFRLKIGQLDFADLAYPLAVDGRQAETIELIGNDTPRTITLPPQINATSDAQAVPWTGLSDSPWTGAAPEVRVLANGGREWRESDWQARVAAETTLAAVDLPWAVNGRLRESGEVDTYKLRVPSLSQGDQPWRLRCEVLADRWGSPLDAVLEVVDGQGKQLGRSDDHPGTTDPRVDVTIPASGETLELRVSSLTGGYGTDAVYRLAVTTVPAAEASLSTTADRLHIPAGDRLVLPVDVAREGTPTDITLALPSALAPALSLETPGIAAADEIGLISLAADRDTRGLFCFPIRFAVDGSQGNEQASLVMSSFPGTEYRPGWRRQIFTAVTAPAMLAIDWQSHPPIDYLAQGTTAEVVIHTDSQADAPLPLRLELLTTQRMPQKQVDNKTVEDRDRALRLAGESNATMLTVPAGRSTSRIKLHVPADLPLHAWGLAVQAEVLTEDGSGTGRKVYTPVRRVPVIAPLELHVDWPEKLSIAVAAEAPVTVKGRIKRHPDFRSAVKIVAVGLGDGEQQAEVVLGEDQREFEFAWRFPEGTAKREVKDVRLKATPVEAPEEWSRIEAFSAPVTLTIE